MNINSKLTNSSLPASIQSTPNLRPQTELLDSSSNAADGDAEPLKEAFQDFVGQTLFGSMLSSMRKSVGKPAYMHGGRAEEVFQGQLDQLIVEDLSDASAQTISDPMFELFQLQRRS